MTTIPLLVDRQRAQKLAIGFDLLSQRCNRLFRRRYGIGASEEPARGSSGSVSSVTKA